MLIMKFSAFSLQCILEWLILEFLDFPLFFKRFDKPLLIVFINFWNCYPLFWFYDPLDTFIPPALKLKKLARWNGQQWKHLQQIWRHFSIPWKIKPLNIPPEEFTNFVLFTRIC